MGKKPRDVKPFWTGKPPDPIGYTFRENAREVLNLYKAAGTKMEVAVKQMQEMITYDSPIKDDGATLAGVQYFTCAGAPESVYRETYNAVNKNFRARGYWTIVDPFRMVFPSKAYIKDYKDSWYEICNEKFSERKRELDTAVETIAKEVYSN